MNSITTGHLTYKSRQTNKSHIALFFVKEKLIAITTINVVDKLSKKLHLTY